MTRRAMALRRAYPQYPQMAVQRRVVRRGVQRIDIARVDVGSIKEGLTLVHFSVQRKRFVWDRGYIDNL